MLILIHIYNAILLLSHSPPTWEYSVILMIYKPNKPNDLASTYSYLISLLSIFAKLFERLISLRIPQLIDQQGILP